MQTVFTTGEAARICSLSPTLIVKHFDSGQLKGFRIPVGSRQRRIPVESLIAYMKSYGIPLGDLADEARMKVILISADTAIHSALRGAVDDSHCRFECVNNEFDAGFLTASLRPDCVVIDFGIGREASLQIAASLRKNPKYTAAIQIGLLSDEDEANVDRTLFAETFRKPFDPALLMTRIGTLTEKSKETL